VDVASAFLDVRIGRDGTELRVTRDAEGIAALIGFCRQHKVDLVVMEASGGVEQLPFLLLWDAAVPCAIVNAFSVRHFAEAMGLFEKTDQIDAGVIAWYAEAKRVVAQEPPSAAQARLTALVRRLGQLTAAKVAQSNQRRLQTDPDVLASIDEVTAVLSRQIRSFEIKIAELLEADPLWRAFDACFRSIKGVADRAVARLMADLPEIGTLSNKAVAKLAGLAPIARDSGKMKKRRRLRGGRASIRSILFVIAEIVRRHNPHFADMHRRLSEAGKPKKVIRIAVARKLLVQLNAKARDVRRDLAITA
jgi:transposase